MLRCQQHSDSAAKSVVTQGNQLSRASEEPIFGSPGALVCLPSEWHQLDRLDLVQKDHNHWMTGSRECFIDSCLWLQSAADVGPSLQLPCRKKAGPVDGRRDIRIISWCSEPFLTSPPSSIKLLQGHVLSLTHTNESPGRARSRNPRGRPHGHPYLLINYYN